MITLQACQSLRPAAEAAWNCKASQHTVLNGNDLVKKRTERLPPAEVLLVAHSWSGPKVRELSSRPPGICNESCGKPSN